ncbi:ChaN family lipoprotein [Palleronia sp.]|uniref:ChaN family lipoprotein n=1 Tax=Palleronia sp. TaxID=1940284 RepID=UPI0035C85D1F
MDTLRNDGRVRIARAACLGAALLSLGAAPTFSQDLVPGADIVVMGEEHDVPEHHLNQARWIEELRPAAVVFEMLPPELGPVATDMAGAPPEELGPALQWEERGWPDLALYAPIFEAAEDARIVGAEVSRADLRLSVREGAAAALDGGMAFGLSEPLSEDERDVRMNRAGRSALRPSARRDAARHGRGAAPARRHARAGGLECV